ncbi:MAG: glutaminyl-peptide cyclotransferase [Alistipes sp.]|jgi:glutamine cyclotransferase|nr:glutaminyl-peptide cyclotransferase [Alistipes sp.]
MRAIFYILAACAMVVSCGGKRPKANNSAVKVAPQMVDIEVVKSFDHQQSAYTQGLQFVDGVMWEGTGEYGSSRLQYTDMATGRVTVVATLPDNHFGEGITLLGDRIYQLTWQNGIMYIYDRKTLKKVDTKRYKGEGWGLTTDGQWLYMSDGTPDIRVLDPVTLEVKRRISVVCNGASLPYLNELEWIDGKIWANVYTLNQIVIINPENGIVEKVVNLEGLLPESEYTPTTDVLNGIAYDKESGRIFVTGKNWSKLFEIRLL